MTNEQQNGADGDHPGNRITIIIEGTEYHVRPGKWLVSDLKKLANIDPSKVLAEITPQGLNDLEDNATVAVHQKQQFMAHARSGGSS